VNPKNHETLSCLGNADISQAFLIPDQEEAYILIEFRGAFPFHCWICAFCAFPFELIIWFLSFVGWFMIQIQLQSCSVAPVNSNSSFVFDPAPSWISSEDSDSETKGVYSAGEK